MKRLLPFAAAAFLGLVASPAGAQALPPVDECGEDFAAFRAQLLDILARRDAAALLEHVDAGIEFSFGGLGPGRDAFAETWGLGEPRTSGLWAELGRVLLLGCAPLGGDEVAAPYLFARFPAEIDPFMGGVALPGAWLYPGPGFEAEGVDIAWRVVIESDDASNGWRRVRLADGRSGYIEDGLLLTPVDYRAIFARRDRRWRLVAFIAGD